MPVTQDNCPAEEADDLKQQNVTTILVQAELCRAIRGHGDLEGLTDMGPWVALSLFPACSGAERLCMCWQRETRCGQKKWFVLSHFSTDPSLPHASSVTEMCSQCFQDQESC